MEINDQLFIPAALPQQKRPQYPLNRCLDGPQGQAGYFREEKNIELIPDSSVIEPVAKSLN
jgi:hypothetical protein